MKFQCRSLTPSYKIISKVGEGSFSEVLKCQDMKTGNYFACKRLRKAYVSPNQITEIPEVLVLQKIGDHLNIIKLFEAIYESNPGSFTLVFEFCDMSLYDLMKTKERGLAETVVRDYIYQLLCGVDFIHEKGILHRDIKPENIFIKGTLIKLGDFGSIKEINSSHPYTEYVSTRWYRSPECLLTTGYYGPKMDIWAVGCVFYELITLKPLFPGTNEIDQIHHIHMIIGLPSSRTMEKLCKHKSSNYDFVLGYRRSSVQIRNTRDHRILHEAPMSFSLPSLHKYHQQDSCRLFLMANKLSKSGRDVLKQMLKYDPDLRCSARQALEHHYFNLIRSSITKLEKLNPFIVNREFSKPYQYFPDIPRRFTKVDRENDHRENSVKATREFLKHYKGEQFLDLIVTREEAWLCHYIPEAFPKVFIQKPLHRDGNKFPRSKNCADTAKGDFQDRWKLPDICAKKEEKSSYRRLNSALMSNLPMIHVQKQFNDAKHAEELVLPKISTLEKKYEKCKECKKPKIDKNFVIKKYDKTKQQSNKIVLSAMKVQK
ncbi:hypothetical protein J437_LFUL011281 [Ladona fulva]|uniref:Protein kinase domain-containing protein n=1 Tax=Ladona fulva TaxID=123851 RepID=A0A8K0KS15_LADFU|nr:hypothetical protein J437_LFUL011281 [Ladona fulva]